MACVDVGNALRRSGRSTASAEARMAYARELLGCSSIEWPMIGNGHGEVAQIEVRISAMQERRVVLRIQIDGFGERLDGRSVGLQIFRTPPALISFLRALPSRRRIPAPASPRGPRLGLAAR